MSEAYAIKRITYIFVCKSIYDDIYVCLFVGLFGFYRISTLVGYLMPSP